MKHTTRFIGTVLGVLFPVMASAQEAVDSGGDEPCITTIGGRLAVSYLTSGGSLGLWLDDGGPGGSGTAGDGVVNGGELRVIDDSAASTGRESSITVYNNRLAVSYWDQTNGALKLWVDDGNGEGGTAGNGLADGQEIRTLDTGAVGRYTSITVFNNRLAVSYLDGGAGRLKLWFDDGAGGGGMVGNAAAEPGELRVIDPAGVGGFTSIAVVNGRLAISYRGNRSGNNLNTKFWYDDGAGGGDDGDVSASGGEIRSFVDQAVAPLANTAIIEYNNRLAIAYVNLFNSQIGLGLKLWVDDNGDGQIAGSEVRQIDNAPNGIELGLGRSLTLIGGRLALAYSYITDGGGTSMLKMWYDDGTGGGTAGDGSINGTEIRTLIGEGVTGRLPSVVSYQNEPATCYRNADASRLELLLGLEEVGGGQMEESPSSPEGAAASTVPGSGISRASGGGSCFLARPHRGDFRTTGVWLMSVFLSVLGVFVKRTVTLKRKRHLV